MNSLPAQLGTGPFSREAALAAGVTKTMLIGRRFVRVFPRVWRCANHEMTEADWLEAARLTLPEHARLTGITRIRKLGLDFGPARPLHFVVEGDLHLDLEGIFLHRTRKLAPHDDEDVVPAAAYLFYCSYARVIDAIKVGDWLLGDGHMTIDEVQDLALAAPWRDGAHEAIWILDHLDGRSRSLPESETRALFEFAGLPRPDVNVEVAAVTSMTVIGDLLFREWGLLVEYEGTHHQTDRLQYTADLERYAAIREHDVPYFQVTHEKLRDARGLVREAHRELVRLGYDGPAPEFGDRWRLLFRPIRDSVGSRNEWLRAYGRGEVA